MLTYSGNSLAHKALFSTLLLYSDPRPYIEPTADYHAKRLRTCRCELDLLSMQAAIGLSVTWINHLVVFFSIRLKSTLRIQFNLQSAQQIFAAGLFAKQLSNRKLCTSGELKRLQHRKDYVILLLAGLFLEFQTGNSLPHKVSFTPVFFNDHKLL